jgi:phosphoserine phosphatase RsbU/P
LDIILTRSQDLVLLLEALQSYRSEISATGTVADIPALTGFLADLDNQLSQIVQGLVPGIEFDLLRKMAMLLARAAEEDEILAAMLDGLKSVLPYDAAGIYLASTEIPLEGTRNKSDLAAIHDQSELSALVVRGYDIEQHKKFRQKFNEGIVGWVIANGESLVVDDIREDPRYIGIRPGTLSEMSVPIISGNFIVGAINLEADQIAAFPSQSVSLLENLASYAAVALERAKTHHQLMEARGVERELEIAHEIQTKLLPKDLPSISGYEFAGLNVPSERVGGDYYDFIPITENDIGIVVADVAGKGFAAGLVMASLRSALRMQVETTYGIRTVIGNVNRFLYDSTGPERFVTAFYGVFDSRTCRLTYVNAGHNPPILIHKDGRIVELVAGGPLLGVVREAEYYEAMAEVEPGAILILYTDGIVEAGGDHGDEFGEERIIDIALTNKHRPANEIAREIELAAVKFHGLSSPLDDRTVLVVKHL